MARAEVLEALASLQFPHIYPDPEVRRLRAALAADCGVPAENLVAGTGADEVIDILMRCVLEPGDVVLNTPPTFGMYAFGAEVNNARCVDVPRLPDFSVDVPGLLAAAAALPRPPRLLFLTSPNNPDGSVLPDPQLIELLEGLPQTMVVLDEAYVEFVVERGGSGGEPPVYAASRLPWVLRYPNLGVLRTFSKRAGLAGLRIGYGAFPADVVPFLWKAKQPYNVSVASEQAALAALANPGYLAEVRRLLVEERARLFALLAAQPGLHPYPSQANFVLVRVDGGAAAAAELRRRLAEEWGIMVRYYSSPAQLAGCIRVSVGKPEHTVALGVALRSILSKV